MAGIPASYFHPNSGDAYYFNDFTQGVRLLPSYYPAVADDDTPQKIENRQVVRQQGTTSNLTSTHASKSERQVATLYSLVDDGQGGFLNGMGSISYGNKTLSVRFLSGPSSTESYESDSESASEFDRILGGQGSSNSNSTMGSSYSTTDVKAEMLSDSSIVVRYKVGATIPQPHSMSYTPPGMTIDLAPYTTDRIVPGSVQFVWMGETYQDFEGRIYRGRNASSNGIESGQIDYSAGVVHMHDYVVGNNPDKITLQSLWTQKSDWRTSRLFFMTEASPIQPGQITITVTDVQGDLINISCDLQGNLSGPHVLGKFEFQNGLGEMQFGDFVVADGLTDEEKAEWWYDPADIGAVEAGKIWRPWPVDPASLRYNSVSNFYLPVDPQILGLDPVRLPQDGRVPIFKKGRLAMIGHNDKEAPDVYSNSQIVQLSRDRISHVWLIGDDGELITEGWAADEADLDAGEVRIIDVDGWSQPVTIEHRIQDLAQITDVQIDGTLAINIPLGHDYPAGSEVSSVLLFGQKFARALPVFSQQTWDAVSWHDSTQGNPAAGAYNEAAFPIEVTNAGALTERWAIRFRANSTEFDLFGEHVGQIASGSINSDFEPVNPFDGTKKLFTLRAAGWGGGWVQGNVLFFQTIGAMMPMACIRTVQPGQATSTDYAFDLLVGGDIDRPPHAPEP